MVFLFFVAILSFTQMTLAMVDEADLDTSALVPLAAGGGRSYHAIDVAAEERLLSHYVGALKEGLDRFRERQQFSLEALPEEMRTVEQAQAWVETRFPAVYSNPFVEKSQSVREFLTVKPGENRPSKTLFVAKAFAQPFLVEELNTLIPKMMRVRTPFVGEYGALSLVLGNEEELHAFQEQMGHVGQGLRDQQADEAHVMEIFGPLEGPEIARKRWAVINAYYAKKAFLDEKECGPLMEQLKEQKTILEAGRIGKLLQDRIRFYRDAFLFFFKGNTEAFGDRKTGVDHLWKHLGTRKREIASSEIDLAAAGVEAEEGEGVSGSDLYACLAQQKGDYLKAREKLVEEITEIREGRKEAPERSSVKVLMDPVRTLDLEAALRRLEDQKLEHLHEVIRLEVELKQKVPNLQEELEAFSIRITEAEDALAEAYMTAALKAQEFKEMMPGEELV